MRLYPNAGWWLPDADDHLRDWLAGNDTRVDGRLTYQRSKYTYALRKTRPERLLAVDVGAHAGLWSWLMAKDFEEVVAFEPLTEHCNCWHKNMEGVANAHLHQVALGDHMGQVVVERLGMKSAVSDRGTVCKLRRLDDFHLGRVDLLKIDVEGYELKVLEGAYETIKRDRPCIIVEQKDSANQARYGLGQNDAVAFLEAPPFRYRRRATINGDHIMVRPIDRSKT